jgi:hypothetical protein
MRWAEHLAHFEERLYACSILLWKPEGNKAVGRQRTKWIHYINNVSKFTRFISIGHWIYLPLNYTFNYLQCFTVIKNKLGLCPVTNSTAQTLFFYSIHGKLEVTFLLAHLI